MADDNGKQKRTAGRGGWWFLAATLLLHAVVRWWDLALSEASLARFVATLESLLPLFGVMFLLLWLFNLLVRPGQVVRRVGRASGARGWVLAVSAGVISMGPMYLWYPVLDQLRTQGLRPALAAAFLYSRAIKLPMLPFMAHYFGTRYTGLFVLCILVFSVASGMAMERADPRLPTRSPEN